jgi:hypothetical protein
MAGYFLFSLRAVKDTLYPAFGYIKGIFLFKKLKFKIIFLNIILIQHVSVLTQINETYGTAIAIYSRKEKLNLCLDKFSITKEA